MTFKGTFLGFLTDSQAGTGQPQFFLILTSLCGKDLKKLIETSFWKKSEGPEILWKECSLGSYTQLVLDLLLIHSIFTTALKPQK